MPKMKREDMVAVFIDHQEGILMMTPAEERKTLEMYLRFMLKGLQALGVPIVVCTNLEEGAGRASLELFREIVPEAWENRIRRTGIMDVFDQPAFVERCAALGRNSIILSGYTTDAVVVPAAISARDRGLHTYVGMDTSGSPAPLADTIAMQRLMQIGAAPVTSFGAINEMVRDMSTPTGIETMKVIFEQIIYSKTSAKL
ncbi:MAG: isochorismatase family protein [Pseudomonadota bacterium]